MLYSHLWQIVIQAMVGTPMEKAASGFRELGMSHSSLVSSYQSDWETFDTGHKGNFSGVALIRRKSNSSIEFWELYVHVHACRYAPAGIYI